MCTLTESSRARLIGEIAAMLREASVPPETRAAGLTLIGWLARRMPGERADTTVAARPSAGPRQRASTPRPAGR